MPNTSEGSSRVQRVWGRNSYAFQNNHPLCGPTKCCMESYHTRVIMLQQPHQPGAAMEAMNVAARQHTVALPTRLPSDDHRAADVRLVKPLSVVIYT